MRKEGRLEIIRDQKGFLSVGWLCLLVGFFLFLDGLISFFQGGTSFMGAYAPVTKLSAIVVLGFGLFFMMIGYKQITKKKPPEVKYLKCPGCGHVCFAHEAPDRKCPKCSGAVENIEGFFDRHPEFRDEGLEKNEFGRR
jgi:ribosomal protein S27E